jgi:hypothetical protein
LTRNNTFWLSCHLIQAILYKFEKLLKESFKSDGEEEFEDTKGVTKIRKSKKNRQCNDQQL